MADSPPGLAVKSCPECGTELADFAVSCPRCKRLIHTEQLKRLAADAEQAISDKDFSRALACWREALDLLPPDSRQSETIAARVDALSRQLDAQPPKAKMPAWAKRLGPLGAALVFLLTKGKLLALGLTKSSTLLSMLLAFGVYWTAWGWKFALGLVVSIYIHEMGHVAALARLGIKATPPMFIPGFGAVVRMKQYPANPSEDARVGLAGPIWGLAAAVAAWAIFYFSKVPIWAAIARVGAWVNLFNLIPVWSLDGSRGFRALSKPQRWLVVLALLLLLALTRQVLLIFILIMAAIRAIGPETPTGDRTALAEYVFLAATLAVLCEIHVPV